MQNPPDDWKRKDGRPLRKVAQISSRDYTLGETLRLACGRLAAPVSEYVRGIPVISQEAPYFRN